MIKFYKKRNKGFTLIELMVSVTVFVTVMVISAGSMLSVIDANRKSQTLRSVVDNLNYSLDSMTRTIRFGTKYHCNINQGGLGNPSDCPDNTLGADSIAVTDSAGNIIVYKLSGTRIAKSVNGGADYYLTGADVTINKMSFRVFGSSLYSSGDLKQPQVIVVIGGYVGSKPSSRTNFTIETTISQRLFDTQ